MSHSTVMVIGDDPEKQLEPFYEQGEPSDYFMEFQDCTNEVQLKFEEFQADPEKSKEYDSLATVAESWFGYVQKGDKWGYYANPNAKWDWYQLGGRWAGSLKLKDEVMEAENWDEVLVGNGSLVAGNNAERGWCDRALKGQIDVDGMVAIALEKACEEYDKFEEVTKGLTPPNWSALIQLVNDEDDPLTIEEARAIYNDSEWTKAVREHCSIFMDPEEHYCVHTGGRTEFINRAGLSALPTFAILYAGQWFEKGSMGWWGLVSDEMSAEEWNQKFMELFNDLHDNTPVAVYDVHI